MLQDHSLLIEGASKVYPLLCSSFFLILSGSNLIYRRYNSLVPLLSAPRHTAQGRVVARAVILAHLAMSCVPPNVLASHAHAGALAAVLAFEAAETLAFMEEHAAARDLLGTGERERRVEAEMRGAV